MSKTMTRRLVAGASAVAVAAGLAVTMGAGAAGAAPGTANANAGAWKITRTISDVAPKAGDTITVLNTLKWTNLNLPLVTALKNTNDSCLTYVPGSAKRNGGALTPELGPDYVRINFSEVYSQYKGAMTFEVKYTVGQNCARNVALQSTVHMAGNLGSNQTPANVGPAITVAKNATVMSVGQVNGPEVGKASRLSAKVVGSRAGDPVEFSVDGTVLGTEPVDAEGWAYYEWTPSSAGNKTVAATYAETSFSSAAGPVTANANVAQGNVASTTTLAPVSGAQVGRASNLVATVATSAVGGTVQFLADGVEIGSSKIADNGKAALSWSPTVAGNASVTAKFLGHNGVGASQTSIGVEVAAKPADSTPSSTTLRVEGAPQVGGTVQLIANVDPKNAGGTVVFSDNGVQVGEATVGEGGVAIFDWTPTEVGFRDLKADFSGNGSVDASSGTSTATVASGAGNPGGGGDAGSLGSLGNLFGSLGR